MMGGVALEMRIREAPFVRAARLQQEALRPYIEEMARIVRQATWLSRPRVTTALAPRVHRGSVSV